MNNHCTLFNTEPAFFPLALNLNEFDRTIVFVPHPDDESIGCGGLINQLYQYNILTRIILVSDGSGAGELDSGAAQKRKQEFNEALSLLHPTCQVEFWDLPDGHLNKHSLLLEDKMTSAIDQFSATHIVAPWLNDLHPDHATVGKCTFNVVQNSHRVNNILFYEVWTPVQANRILDISSNYSVKEAALKCHKTALECGFYVRAMQGLSCYRSLLTEHLAKPEHYAEAFLLYNKDDSTELTDPSFVEPDNSHQQAIKALYASVYSQQPFENWWEWKYASSIVKGMILQDTSGHIFAFYGNISRLAYFKHQTFWTSQIADVMIQSEFRSSANKTGPFYRLSKLFLDKYVGDSKAFPFSFGFPHIRALKLGTELKLYQYGDQLFEWSCVPKSSNRSFVDRLMYKSKFIENRSIDSLFWLNEVFDKMKQTLNDHLVLERTAQHWFQRYFEHPCKQYDCLTLSFMNKEVAGIIFLINEDSIEVMDLAFSHKKYISQLLNALQRHALRLNIPLIKAWGTESYINSLTDSKNECKHIGWIALPDNAIGATITEEAINNCWFCAGDSDFK